MRHLMLRGYWRTGYAPLGFWCAQVCDTEVKTKLRAVAEDCTLPDSVLHVRRYVDPCDCLGARAHH